MVCLSFLLAARTFALIRVVFLYRQKNRRPAQLSFAVARVTGSTDHRILDKGNRAVYYVLVITSGEISG